MKKIDRELHTECMMHAADSRRMWLAMKSKGYGWTWDYYRGWLLDARAFRLGREFQALGSNGAKRHLMPR